MEFRTRIPPRVDHLLISKKQEQIASLFFPFSLLSTSPLSKSCLPRNLHSLKHLLSSSINSFNSNSYLKQNIQKYPRSRIRVCIGIEAAAYCCYMGHPSLLVSREQAQNRAWALTLIPKLPNDLAALILAFLPYPHHSRLKSVSRSWRFFFSSKNLGSVRENHLPVSRKSHLLCIFPEDPLITSPYLFDPTHLAWCQIPPMPCNPHVYGLCNFKAISIGTHLYVLGGSLFDTRSFPLDRPCPTDAAFRFDFVRLVWERLSPMITPRGSFACAAMGDKIVVAGGGSRHTMFGAAGSRMSSVEMYDVRKNEWVELDGLPRFRAGCVGFSVGSGEEREFWVMGGYGESRTISGVFPVDEYYRDAAVMEVKTGGKWRELGNMWEEAERRHFGKIVVVEDEALGVPGIFMLDKNHIFRYDMSVNRWSIETSLPRKLTDASAVGCVALNGELLVMINLNGIAFSEGQRAKYNKRPTALFLQIYHPKKKSWRSLVTKPPQCLDLTNAVLCPVQF